MLSYILKANPVRETVDTQYGGFVTKHTGHAGEQGINNNCKCAVCRIFGIFAESKLAAGCCTGWIDGYRSNIDNHVIQTQTCNQWRIQKLGGVGGYSLQSLTHSITVWDNFGRRTFFSFTYYFLLSQIVFPFYNLLFQGGGGRGSP